jgi:hypothetical protein
MRERNFTIQQSEGIDNLHFKIDFGGEKLPGFKVLGA